MSAKRKPLTVPFMVRMEHLMKEEIQEVAAANGLSRSDIVRIACSLQLPALRRGQSALKPPTKSLA